MNLIFERLLMSIVLGLDGGGTMTVCVLMDETAQVLGRGEAG